MCIVNKTKHAVTNSQPKRQCPRNRRAAEKTGQARSYKRIPDCEQHQ